MCSACKEETSKMIFRLVVPFANRSANLRLADWPANLQIGQIGRLVGTQTLTQSDIITHIAYTSITQCVAMS